MLVPLEIVCYSAKRSGFMKFLEKQGYQLHLPTTPYEVALPPKQTEMDKKLIRGLFGQPDMSSAEARRFVRRAGVKGEVRITEDYPPHANTTRLVAYPRRSILAHEIAHKKQFEKWGPWIDQSPRIAAGGTLLGNVVGGIQAWRGKRHAGKLGAAIAGASQLPQQLMELEANRAASKEPGGWRTAVGSEATYIPQGIVDTALPLSTAWIVRKFQSLRKLG